jgi:protein TonB
MRTIIKAFIVCVVCCGIAAAAAVAEGQKSVPGKPHAAEETAPVQSKTSGGKTIPLITIFGSAEGPKFEEQVPPEYPFAAKQRGIEGTVVLRLSIDELGMLQDVELIKATDPVFVDAAVASVKKSFFIPAKNNRRPVPSQAILPIHFKLKKRL